LLLDDLDEACHYLISKGIHVRATVFPVNELGKDTSGAMWRHISIAPCPSHNKLPSLLKGADILFLPERFDESSEGIRMSISSKAPLFMLSGKPIVVYSAPVTGIARYAAEKGWAAILNVRDPIKLARTFEKIITNSDERQGLVTIAKRTAMLNHDLKKIQSSFAILLKRALSPKRPVEN
jgi:glycosyltransferase involved in cell wall biosynthesis